MGQAKKHHAHCRDFRLRAPGRAEGFLRMRLCTFFPRRAFLYHGVNSSNLCWRRLTLLLFSRAQCLKHPQLCAVTGPGDIFRGHLK